jgi:hypothetical protein
MPGTTTPGEKADSSVAWKKFSGTRFRVKVPRATRGTSLSGQRLVGSRGLNRNELILSAGMSWTESSHLGKRPAAMFS